MKKHIGYKVEAGGDFDIALWFKGFITYFDGKQIIITSSDRFIEKKDAWKWIGNTLAEWEQEHTNCTCHVPTPPQDWEQKTRHEFYDTFTDDGFVCNDNPHDIADWWIDECKSLLQQERERMVKGLEGMKKWDEPDRSKSPMFTYKDVTRPYNRGFNDALSSAIALIENNPLPSRREDKG